MGLDCESTSGGPPSGLQWPRDMAAISPLVCGWSAEKTVKSAREEVVRDPDVVWGRGRNWRGCASAGNGRTSHQASRWCNWCEAKEPKFGVEPNSEAPTLDA